MERRKEHEHTPKPVGEVIAGGVAGVSGNSLIFHSLDDLEAYLARPLTPEELARRAQVIDATLAHRAAMPPLGMNAADLIREIRDGDEVDG